MELSSFEIVKMPIVHPTLQNWVLLSAFLFVTMISAKRAITLPLDKTQTTQLKGVAIFLVVLGHLWYHVSQCRATPILGDYAVTLFLALSGYGLTLSHKSTFSLRQFLTKRLTKVMLPYWVATILVLLTDWLLLGKKYSATNIVYTWFGVNVDIGDLDYSRWYISLLLPYYVTFALAYKIFDNAKATVFIAFSALFIIVLRALGIFPFGTLDQLIGFPLGCAVAQNKCDLQALLRGRSMFKWTLFTLFLLAAMSTVLFLRPYWPFPISRWLLSLLRSISSLLFCGFLVLLIEAVGRKNRISTFLVMLGSVSFEIYLIHGPLLIKYNPFFRLFPDYLIGISFSIFFTAIILLSYGLRSTTASLLRLPRFLTARVANR